MYNYNLPPNFQNDLSAQFRIGLNIDKADINTIDALPPPGILPLPPGPPLAKNIASNQVHSTPRHNQQHSRIIPRPQQSGDGPYRTDSSSTKDYSVSGDFDSTASLNLDSSSSFKERISPIKFNFPQRPNVGSLGKSIALKANFFKIEMPSSEIHHYEIEIKPDKCPRRVNREIVDTMVRRFASQIFVVSIISKTSKKQL